MNHYEILGVGPDATEQQIKEAYRREAMKWHPDRHDGAAAKGEADRRFKDLAVAYRTLRNPVDRANYDRQLEQKLRQEYEARQQEQARQQRTQSEHAQQKQARQEPPQRDFENTGPQFEEQTASNDDANQMFYEQMLDLAFELAGRGFPEFNIFKALVALGCPEALAKAVAATAAKHDQGKQYKGASKPNDTEFASSKFNDEFAVKPKRHLAILGALFGIWSIYMCVTAWNVSIGSAGWAGERVMQYFFRIVGGPFGALMLFFYGQVSVTNTLMIFDRQGIRFSRGGGRITKWSEIKEFTFDEKHLQFSGVKNGKKWVERVPKWLVAGDCRDIVSQIDQFKTEATVRAQARHKAGDKPAESDEPTMPRSSRKTEPEEPTSHLWEDWKSIEPYFSAALVGPNFNASIKEEFGIVKIVRGVLFVVFSLVLFGLFTQGVTSDAETVVGSAITSILLGWGTMFVLLELSPTHRNYVLTSRVKNYLPRFHSIFNSEAKWKEPSSAIFFPAPWFAYYGIMWPLITVAAVFFTVDFLFLISVDNNVHTRTALVEAWEFFKKPWFSLAIWVGLAYSFNYLLFSRIKAEILKVGTARLNDVAQHLYDKCRPRLWRAFVGTAAFLLLVIAPSEFIFPAEKEMLDTVLAVKKLTPTQMLEQAKPRFTDDSYQGTLSTTAALQMLRISADKGHVPAESFLGYIYGWGLVVTKNEKVSSYWIERAANHGDIWSTDMLGNMKYKGWGGFSKNEAEAVAHWRTAAELGSPSAQTSLGWSYMIGIGGTPIDFQKAASWNEKGANGGNAEGFNNLGWLYENGQGVPRNVAHAAALYRRAAELGSEQAKQRLLTVPAGGV